jgi:hypothetical protein
MSYTFHVGDYGPVSGIVTDDQGELDTPLSGTATVVNQHTGEVVVENGACTIGLGFITYYIPEGSDISENAGRYIVYLSAEMDANTKLSDAISVDVIEKSASLAVDRWRRKVEFAAPEFAPDGTNPLSEAEGRDWIDQAVDFINRYYDTGYTSTLASITPEPTANDVEFIASVASLMSRTAWWAGKGEWRDDEMSWSDGPFRVEWNRIFAVINQKKTSDDWYTDYLDETTNYDNYNRDRVFYPGKKYDSGDYWWVKEAADDFPV